MDAENVVEEFTTLSEEELTNTTVGVYQLRLTRSYCQCKADAECQGLVLMFPQYFSILDMSGMPILYVMSQTCQSI